jgi:hypothetical protein
MGKHALKTKAGRASVAGFIARIRDAERREDCKVLVRMMKQATGQAPRMWGSMIGFGNYHYQYASGHEGDCFLVGFASRKPDLVIYLQCGLPAVKSLLAKLGKHRTGVGCLYVRRLADVDLRVLEKLVAGAVGQLKRRA